MTTKGTTEAHHRYTEARESLIKWLEEALARAQRGESVPGGTELHPTWQEYDSARRVFFPTSKIKKAS